MPLLSTYMSLAHLHFTRSFPSIPLFCALVILFFCIVHTSLHFFTFVFSRAQGISAGQRSLDAATSDLIQQLQTELVSVRFREAETNGRLREMQDRVRELEEVRKLSFLLFILCFFSLCFALFEKIFCASVITSTP